MIRYPNPKLRWDGPQQVTSKLNEGVNMKSKERLLTKLFEILAELQERKELEYHYNRLRANPESSSVQVVSNALLYSRLRGQLSVLYDILGDDVPEEYWEQIEEII